MKSVVRNTLIVLTALGMAAVSACGRKGALVPPEALVPAAVGSLDVRQQGGDLLVSWSAPTREQGGRPLRDLAGFQLLRRQLLPGEADCSACPEAWRPLAGIDLEMPRSVERAAGLFFYRDRGVTPEIPTQYRIVARSASGGVSRSADTPLRRVHPAPPSPSLKAALTPTAIALEPAVQLPAGGEPAGFNIYRRSAGAAWSPLPQNSAPVSGPAWEDRQVEFGSSYSYRATTLLRVGGELVESTPSQEVEILFTQQELR